LSSFNLTKRVFSGAGSESCIKLVQILEMHTFFNQQAGFLTTTLGVKNNGLKQKNSSFVLNKLDVDG